MTLKLNKLLDLAYTNCVPSLVKISKEVNSVEWSQHSDDVRTDRMTEGPVNKRAKMALISLTYANQARAW